MLEFRMVQRQLTVIVNANHQDVSLIVLKPVKIFLSSDLVHGDIRAVSKFQLDQQCGLLRILRRRQIDHIRITLASVQFKNSGVILSGSIIGKLDSIAQSSFIVVCLITGLIMRIFNKLRYLFLAAVPCCFQKL